MNMGSTNTITLAYIKENYEIENKINDKVSLVSSKIDGARYILKSVDINDVSIYDFIKKNAIVGIPRIFDIAVSDNQLFVVEEYIDCKNLEDNISLIKNEDDIVRILNSICNSLEVLHHANPPIIHRDIKPQNILLDNDKTYLIDFDISRRYKGDNSKDTFIRGTEYYAAPEQYGFSESDPRTDIYAIGVTTKFILDTTGIKSKKLERFVKKCTEIDPNNRFQNIREVRLFLKRRIAGYLFENRFKYALPGYRTGNIFKAILATIVYGNIIVYCFFTESNTGMTKSYDVLFSIYQFIVLMAFPLITFNYLNIHNKLFGINKLKWYFKYPIAVFISAVFFVLMSLLFVFFDILIGY